VRGGSTKPVSSALPACSSVETSSSSSRLTMNGLRSATAALYSATFAARRPQFVVGVVPPSAVSSGASL
jgi:hypothetical protein